MTGTDGIPSTTQTLIDFRNIFASEGGPIPNGASITSATLTLDLGGLSPGFPQTVLVHRMVSAWAEADEAARQVLRPGTNVADLYHVLINAVEERGFISPYRPGHSIGLDALDFWSITGDSDKVLKSGMVIAVHPSVMLEFGGDACGMGYTYLINEAGAERLSKIDLAKELLG